MTELIRYEAACRALYEAKSVDEVKDMRDKAAALKAYARQAKNRQLEIDAAEIRMRAERRIGELMEYQRETVGLAKGGKPYQSTGSQSDPVAPTLSEAGIDKHLADRARKMAAVPEEKFEAALGEWREKVQEETARVTSSLLDMGSKAHVSNNSGDNEWNGLAAHWEGVVWMNPPYEQPLCQQFTAKLTKHVLDGDVSQACVLVNNATETKWFQGMTIAASAICFPEGRIKFWHPEKVSAPLQGQAIIYFGDNVDGFMANFKGFGFVARI